MIQGALISLPVVSRHGIFFWFLRSLVKVRWTFFLVTVLLGLRTRSVEGVLTWMFVAFLAVLLHECGHALAARFYRQSPQIELHAMGGVTRWDWVDHLRWTQRVAIAIAGPAAGFLLGGMILMFDRLGSGIPDWLWMARYQFLWATLAWGVFNLLPLMPLDGGQAMAEVLEHRMGGDAGRRLARQISIGTGIAGFALGAAAGEAWVALLCGILAFDNYQRMRGLPGVGLPG